MKGWERRLLDFQPAGGRNGLDLLGHGELQHAVGILGLNLIDADHFCTENPVMPILAEKLRGAFPEVEFRLSTRHRQIISVY